jgi:hypothetical protein
MPLLHLSDYICTGTLVDMKISGWRLNILIADKFDFTSQINDFLQLQRAGNNRRRSWP